MSKLTEGSWEPERNPVVWGFVGAAVSLCALFGWRPPTDWVNTAADVLSGAAFIYAMLKSRSKVSPVE